MVGDTGSVKHSDFQQLIADALSKQIQKASDPQNRPAFLYHLGDIVYNHGELSEYPAQFLEPYSDYPAPIFAIPGNHDGDVNPDSPVRYSSLDAFMKVFCDTESRPLLDVSTDTRRWSMVQPNVYWTLVTPLARFIGLYANVTKHGVIDDEQRRWFIQELEYARRSEELQALIVCIHHAPYSADVNHGSSIAMIDFLESCFEATRVRPDAVFSGHVHAYQRFLRRDADGHTTPYIVAGAGGYADLHPVATLDDPKVDVLPVSDAEVQLEASCDNCFGFLKVTVEKTSRGISLEGEYYTLPEHLPSTAGEVEPQLYDSFIVHVKQRQHSASLA